MTLSTGGPVTPRFGILPHRASDVLHEGAGSRWIGRSAVKAVRAHGTTLSISALFGARPPAPSLLRQTNQLLTSLTVT